MFTIPADGRAARGLGKISQDVRGMPNHKAIIIPDPGKAAHAFEKAGYPIAWEGVMAVGIEVYMVDTRALYGHMIELFEPSEMVESFYAMVKSAAVGFDGADPVRDFAF